MITVKHLISLLQVFPSDTVVSIHGYEGGIDDISKIEEIEVVVNYNENRFYSSVGSHELLAEALDKGKKDEEKIEKRILIN